MAKIKFLYLDDNDKVTRDGDVELINSLFENLEIVTDYPSSWNKRSTQIILDIERDIDGLIFDWEFTNQSKEAKEGCADAEDVDFSAESLAEHIRVSVGQNKLNKDVPIILCSADLKNSFTDFKKREVSSRDIFDLSVFKSEIFDKNVNVIGNQLIDLANTYKFIQENKYNLDSFLGLKEGEKEEIDVRFIDSLESLALTTAHDLVQFILREFIEKEGLVIDEMVLAARLGVDYQKSTQEWEKLLDRLKQEGILYQGILSFGWTRFWAFRLEQWWSQVDKETELQTLTAESRVEILNKKFNLNLIVAEKIKFCSSSRYWTICKGTLRPLDPLNGFLIGQYISYPWQLPEYVSAFAELEKSTETDNWKINILDRERFKEFKKRIP